MEWSRRSFLKILGLGALSTAWTFSSCRGPGKKAIPYHQTPEWTIPGTATLYATTWISPWGGIPLLATTHEGRPTMLEPNSKHPDASGCPIHATAALWDLYSPDRSRNVLFKGQALTKDGSLSPAEFAGAFKTWSQRIKKDARAAFVVEDIDSPTLRVLFEKLKAKNPGLMLFRDTSFRRNHQAEAVSRFYETPARVQFHFEKANRILSLDCDFLGIDSPGRVKGFFDRRSPENSSGMNRLYIVEPSLTLTGGMADERLPVHPDRMPAIIHALARGIIPLPDFEKGPELTEKENAWLDQCLSDLKEHRGKSLILLGAHYPPDWHAAIHLLNKALGNTGPGTPMEICSSLYPLPPGLESLKEELDKKEFDYIFWLSPGNPLTDDKEWEDKLPGDKLIHLGLFRNSLSDKSQWHVPASHFLESWGDYLSAEGALSLQQPLILPLHESCSPLEFLLGLLGEKGRLSTAWSARGHLSPAYAAVKSTFLRRTQAQDKELSWSESLKAGFQKTQTLISTPPARELPSDFLPSLLKQLENTASQGTPASPTLLQRPDYSLLDGRFINNAWLQECPDPVSKQVWGNAALVSPCFLSAHNNSPEKQELHLSFEDGSSQSLPCLAIPGISDDVIILPRGYGQPRTGIVGEGIGFSSLSLKGKQIKRASFHPCSTALPILSQKESALNDKSFILTEAPSSPLPEPVGKDPLHQWGMCIDLSKCTGCNACVLACQAENNIPIVGAEQAEKNRLMHWLHIDRYFAVTEEGKFDLLVQPRACQQCENAPCESVCPMNATVHTAEGLNSMTYSRCVGTRYCANNCPYKVRRFNYFDYNKYNPYLPGNLEKGLLAEKQPDHSLHLQRNPNVTVRMRGIMEKCTYCVQRIEAAKIRQKRLLKDKAAHDGTPSDSIEISEQELRIPPDSIQCACQSACPAGAITFGNLLDKEQAAVYLSRKSPRAYTLLDHLGVHPRTAYLARIKNPVGKNQA